MPSPWFFVERLLRMSTFAPGESPTYRPGAALPVATSCEYTAPLLARLNGPWLPDLDSLEWSTRRFRVPKANTPSAAKPRRVRCVIRTFLTRFVTVPFWKSPLPTTQTPTALPPMLQGILGAVLGLVRAAWRPVRVMPLFLIRSDCLYTPGASRMVSPELALLM